MREYCPDRWVLLKMNYGGEVIHKVFAGWVGGYTQGDSWKLSSGVVGHEKKENEIFFKNHSGSIYRCHEAAEGMSGYMGSLLSYWQEEAAKPGSEVKIEIVPFEQFQQG